MGEHVPDMVNLTALDEESMNNNLKLRFDEGEVYTSCGHIIVSVNPFRWLPIYSEDLILRYHAAEDPFASEPPHVYCVAHGALNEVAVMASRGLPMHSQSILVSGESGAGKTEATKICMRYLAVVDALCSTSGASGAGNLTERILQTNPILEAFGNAQTVRNDNSSRFGKFLRLHYSSDARQLGAHIDTYLLERSRVVRPPDAEANYHVFYALVHAGELASSLELQGEDAYPSLTPGNGHERQFLWSRLSDALDAVGFTEPEQLDLAKALAAVLALGLLGFDGSDDAEGNRVSSVSDGEGRLGACAARLEVEPTTLAEALCTRRTFLPTGDSYVRGLNEEQAADGRDALVKSLYGRLFDFLVAKLNGLIAEGGERGGEGQSAFIGILDIFGFESFTTNSFEQLCINFANEMLQQQFNADVFRQQQKEYEAEGVPWQQIEYQDNGPVLDLIRGKRTGILALLDEECRLQSGTPAAFVTKLTTAHKGSELLTTPKMQKNRDAPSFTVAHYAGKVTYDTLLFLPKNTDPLHPELLELLIGSASAFLSSLFTAKAAPEAGGGAAAKPGQQTGAGGGGAKRAGEGRGHLTRDAPPPVQPVLGAPLTSLLPCARARQARGSAARSSRRRWARASRSSSPS